MTTITTTKRTVKDLKWLATATSKDQSRPVLTAIHRQNGYMIAADGFRLHAIPTPPEVAEALPESANVKLGMVGESKGSDAALVELTPAAEDWKYPDLHHMFLDAAREPVIRITVDPDLLIKAIGDAKTGGHNITLSIFGSDLPVVVQTEPRYYNNDTPQRYALIMPLHINDTEAARRWSPGKRIQNGR